MAVGGDEHHYLTQAESLLDDGDLVVVDDYEQGLYVPYYGRELDPSLWNLMGAAGFSGHAPGTGVLIAPGIWAGGWSGVVVTLALAMSGAFWMTARATQRLTGEPLIGLGWIVLIGGFLSVPLLPYSHTLYPESFMTLFVAGLMYLVISHARTPRRHQTSFALLAITVSGLSIALHPKYSVVHVGVMIYFVVVEAMHDFMDNRRIQLRRPAFYAAYGGLWLLILSWLHDLMWGTFSPTGWFAGSDAAIAVGPGRAFVQFVDLVVGSEFGILVLMPICILAVVFFIRSTRRPLGSRAAQLTLFALLMVLAIAVPAAFSSDWHAGDSPLARYLTPLLPLLLGASAIQAQKARRETGATILSTVLVAMGLTWSLAYVAVPTGFRPTLFGAGAFGVMAEVVPVFSHIERSLWTFSRPSPVLVTITAFVLLFGLSLWLLPKGEHSADLPSRDRAAKNRA